MDRIVETVNRLLSAFKMPDGATDANRTLGDMQYPQLSSQLPYRDYDKDSGLLMNNSSDP